jgi:hypothetical protein
MRDQPQERDAREAQNDRLLAQLHQRPERIRPRPLEGAPTLARQRLRQSEQPERRVEQRERGGREERHARTERAEQPANRRSEHEADAECGADEAEVLRALLGRTDVRDVGVCRRVRSAGYACDEAAGEQPPQHRRESHDEVVDTQRKQRSQQHRAPSEPIAEIADNRRAEELGDGINEIQPAAVARGLAQARAAQVHDQRRQHGNDDPEADRVDQHRDEDKDDRGAVGCGHGAESGSAACRRIVNFRSRSGQRRSGRPLLSSLLLLPLWRLLLLLPWLLF